MQCPRCHAEMERVVVPEACQRIIEWAEETTSLFGLIQQLLDENEQLRAGTIAAARERERLREQINGLRTDIQQFRQAIRDIQKVINRMTPKLTEEKPPSGPPSTGRGSLS